LLHVLFGTLMGLLFLPLCASLPFFLFHEQDDPTYFARCTEFGFPMTIAGAIGGYTFWSFSRRVKLKRESAADEFS
jgi:hypothetical protein